MAGQEMIKMPMRKFTYLYILGEIIERIHLSPSELGFTRVRHFEMAEVG
jgi:hypothetical protein